MMKNNERRVGRIAALKWLASHPEFEGCGLTTEDEIWDLLINAQDAYTPAERLYFCLMSIDEFNCDRTESAAFWESVLEAAHPDMDELFEFAACILEEFGSLSEEDETEEDDLEDDLGGDLDDEDEDLDDEDDSEAGYQDGVTWGEETATKAQLGRLRRFFGRPDFETWFSDIWLNGLITCGKCPQCTFAGIVEPRRSTARLLGSFIEVSMESHANLIEDDMHYGRYLHGFVEGALSVA